MHNYKQSKKQVAIRWFTYGILTFAVLALSTIGILAVQSCQSQLAADRIDSVSQRPFRGKRDD
jgi:hypothetical protein